MPAEQRKLEHAVSQSYQVGNYRIDPNKPEIPAYVLSWRARNAELGRAGAVKDSERLVGRAVYFGESAGPFPIADRVVIEPGAFADSLRRDRHRIFASDGHNEAAQFARMADGTLELGEDSQGLWFEIEPADDWHARAIFNLVRARQRRAVSMQFFPYEYEIRNGVCIVYRARLAHIALTNSPKFRRTWIAPVGEGCSARARVRQAEIEREFLDVAYDEFMTAE